MCLYLSRPFQPYKIFDTATLTLTCDLDRGGGISAALIKFYSKPGKGSEFGLMFIQAFKTYFLFHTVEDASRSTIKAEFFAFNISYNRTFQEHNDKFNLNNTTWG